MDLEAGRFKNGSKMSRRSFLKLIGGLATLPIVGKFFKGAKTAAKVTEAATSTSGVPAYFPKLVEKIKKFGDDVTEKAAVTERQRVTEYKNYTLEEDLSTGDIRVVKTEEGGEELFKLQMETLILLMELSLKKF